MAVRFVNNFRAPLASSVSSDATTLSFPAGYGDLFRAALGSALGSDHIYGTLFNSGGDIEIVKITATVDDDFTVVRGVDGTTSKAWLAGDYMACRPCAASLSEAVSLPTDLARSGINLDITELRGLTTPLSVEQGGTGGVNLAALISAMGVEVGVDVMAHVAPGASGNLLISNGTDWVSQALAFTQSKTEQGYVVLPGGLIIQWGTTTGSGTGNAVTFPMVFPTACLLVVNSNGDGTANENAVVSNVSNSTSGFVWRSSSGVSTRNNWMAFGH